LEREHIDSLSMKMFLSFKSLQSLDLTLDESFDDKGLEELFNGLKSLSLLSELTLEISQNLNISDKGLFALSGGLKFLKSLSHVAFYFMDLFITEEGINSISQSFKYLNYLVFHYNLFLVQKSGTKD